MLFWRKKRKSRHRLVCLGDSASQGFKNGGIYRTDLSYPAFLARCFDLSERFDQPIFTAQTGLPMNLEMLLRSLQDFYGPEITWSEYVPAAKHVYETLRRIKRYWEQEYSRRQRDTELPYHNQSVWGFAVNDAWLMTDRLCEDFIQKNHEGYSIFDVLPEHAMYVTARCVLNPGFRNQYRDNSLIDNVQTLQDNGGIENLIAYMGHNNIIGAVTGLDFRYSEDDEVGAMPYDRQYTVYRPEHFEHDFRKLAEKVSRVDAERIFTATIPYITIPPVTHGINPDGSEPRDGYFDYYTHFWIWDDEFNPDIHNHLTREEVIELDLVVDAYNQVIRDVAHEYGWIVVPMNHFVNRLAYRRHYGKPRPSYPEGFIDALRRNPQTEHLVADEDAMRLSSEYIELDPETGKLKRGGIFSLDGIHPTTIGYGLMAGLFYETMKKNGVQFDRPIDWDAVIASDTLVTDPPYLLQHLKEVLRFLTMDYRKEVTELGSNLLAQMLSLMTFRTSTPGEMQSASENE